MRSRWVEEGRTIWAGQSVTRYLGGWAGLGWAGYLATCHLSDRVTQDGLSMNNNHRLTSHSLQNVTNKLSLQIGISTLSLVDMAGRLDCCIMTFDLLNIVANSNSLLFGLLSGLYKLPTSSHYGNTKPLKAKSQQELRVS